MRKKMTAWLLGIVTSLGLAGCASVDIQAYANKTPKFDLFQFFAGKTYAWGQFQDRSGEVIRRFTVTIDGQVTGDQLVLDERFVYDDGEQEQRVWTIRKNAQGQYIGTAGDVIGEAQGVSAGNAFNWRYVLDLPYKKSTIHVSFDDWMFMHTPNTMMNRAEVTKFGFKVGEVTLFFSKQEIRS
jgi:hypothetical protein